MSLASAIASASVLKRNSGATGPKVSSRDDQHVGRHVGRARSARRTCRRSAWRLPPVTTLAPLASASATCSSTFSTRVRVDQRALRHAGLGAVADLERLHLRGELLRRTRRRRRPARRGGWRRRRSGRRCGTCEAIAPSTAASRSASSNTMNGALPPSSSESFLIVGAHCAHQHAADLGRAGEGQLAHGRVGAQLAADRAATSPVTTLSTPGGMPARCASSASASAENGVCLGRLDDHRCSRRPAPGATLRVIIALGKFHGVIAAQTPIGCLMTTMRLSLPMRAGWCRRRRACLPRRTIR